MPKSEMYIDKVRLSRAGHTFHERWTARRALQLIFPKDNLFAIVVEGLSSNENLKLGDEAEDIADLVLYYGDGDTFETCSSQQILQFKYRGSVDPVNSSYLKKTLKKFSATLNTLRKIKSREEIAKKLSFGFVTNAEFSTDLWDAISALKSGDEPTTNGSRRQLNFLETWCREEHVEASEIFPLIEFRASTHDLPTQNRQLRRTVSNWSSNSTGQAAIRLFALVELVREKAQVEGQGNNSIRREDVLNALECDEDQLFPADTRFVDIGEVVERESLESLVNKVAASSLPVFLHADGGVGKTVFVQSLASQLSDKFEVVVFDCFGGGSYRSEAQARHSPKIGMLQIVNELATRGLCDPMLPTDSDQYGLIEVARKRLRQASETVRNQSKLQGILVVLDAADNAQIEADARGEPAFPRLLLASLSSEPIDGVRLLLTARPHRMDKVIGKSEVERVGLEPFTETETRAFLAARRGSFTEVEFSTALARSRGNARVLEYLVESWDANVSNNAPRTEISVEALIEQRCTKIFGDLHTAGWQDAEVREFFAALSLLPPPIPLEELAESLGWSQPQVDSAASDLAPMLEFVTLGVIFRDEPTETYIKDHYASERAAQQSIAVRLQNRQEDSVYAAEALPHFLVVIGDSDRAYQLASSSTFPISIQSEYGKRRLQLARLHAAFSLATREKDLDRTLSLTMQLSQVASANARGDQFIRRAPALAMTLGDPDASRRLFNDRTGWRGARDARLTVAYCFSNELDEARIYQSRTIGWVNWYLQNQDEGNRFNQPSLDASDIAAVMFLSVLENQFSSFNRNIHVWRFKFALSIVDELIALCEQHEAANGSEALQNLASFAASKRCRSLALQIGLLSKECGLSKTRLKAVSRAASSLSQRNEKKVSEDNFDHERALQSAVSGAALASLMENSRQSAKRLLKLCQHRRPSSYDYGERHSMNRIWAPVQSACVAAWSSGQPLSYQHLIPNEVAAARKASSISTEADLKIFLGNLIEPERRNQRRSKRTRENKKQFSDREREDITKGIACVLSLVKPIEKDLLSKVGCSSVRLTEFLALWKATLRPNVHWNAETGRDVVARRVGFGVAKIFLRHSDQIERRHAEELLEILSANRFTLDDKLTMLALIARRANLSDMTGSHARSLSREILGDDYIEQRGESFRELACSLVPMSINEAQEYYSQGLAQLDQMGGDDFDLVYSALHYAAEQPGGYVKPESAHRLMGLCQTIFQHEPQKFAWTLFGRAAATSFGFTAMYKLLRWQDQEVADYSYGLPQFVCFFAKVRCMDPRRAAILLTICEDHGWHEWQIGDGLRDLLSVAEPGDRKTIFLLVASKLEMEHSYGGWEGLWKGLLSCLDAYEEIDLKIYRKHLEALRDEAKKRNEREFELRSYKSSSAYNISVSSENNDDEQSIESEFNKVIDNCNVASASSLDEALALLQSAKQFQYDHRKRFLSRLVELCPYDKRQNFLEAICESTELEFDDALNLIIDCFTAWEATTAHLRNNPHQIITRLFKFKGSEFFDLRYSGIPRQIHRLSELSGDAKFVLHIVLETIAKERVALNGDEWLQVASSLSSHAKPETALDAFEALLSSSAAKVGDEIGEGPFRGAFAGKDSEAGVTADIIWHMLGDSDAYVRWNAARSIKAMLDLRLVEDVGRLLDLFDVSDNAALASEGHHFAIRNAQQWLLMGLARAALHHGKSLEPLRPRLERLAARSDLHAINKIHLARCLTRVAGGDPEAHEPAELWSEVRTPPRGVIVRDGWPEHKDRQVKFDFDYEFNKHEISGLARLFGISDNEAKDYVANEVMQRWPGKAGMSDFPGGASYRRESTDRYESYREHIQKHALFDAATTLAKSRPTVRPSYESARSHPWQEWMRDKDVSFPDGSWLSDHKDRVPSQALECLLGERKENQEFLLESEALFEKIGFAENLNSGLLPLYGHWTSTDGVHVRFSAALTGARGAVGQCAKFSKVPDHDLWLPMLGSDGFADRFSGKSAFDPLIWEPEKHPIGVDEGDEWAARGAIARPQLGKAQTRALGLKPDKHKRLWHDSKKALALKSETWGEWRPDPDVHKSRYQNEGSILWAEREWLDEVLKQGKHSLIQTINFSKYKSRTHYDDASGVRAVYVGLRQSGKSFRHWFAKKASKTVY